MPQKGIEFDILFGQSSIILYSELIAQNFITEFEIDFLLFLKNDTLGIIPLIIEQTEKNQNKKIIEQELKYERIIANFTKVNIIRSSEVSSNFKIRRFPTNEIISFDQKKNNQNKQVEIQYLKNISTVDNLLNFAFLIYDPITRSIILNDVISLIKNSKSQINIQKTGKFLSIKDKELLFLLFKALSIYSVFEGNKHNFEEIEKIKRHLECTINEKKEKNIDTNFLITQIKEKEIKILKINTNILLHIVNKFNAEKTNYMNLFKAHMKSLSKKEETNEAKKILDDIQKKLFNKDFINFLNSNDSKIEKIILNYEFYHNYNSPPSIIRVPTIKDIIKINDANTLEELIKKGFEDDSIDDSNTLEIAIYPKKFKKSNYIENLLKNKETEHDFDLFIEKDSGKGQNKLKEKIDFLSDANIQYLFKIDNYPFDKLISYNLLRKELLTFWEELNND